MDTKTVYSTKAEKYAKYRWDYASEAIDEIVGKAQLSSKSTLADIGAGTGILTKHFVDKVQRVFAIEPNLELRQILSNDLSENPTVSVLDGAAENTKLASRSVDIITVAQAIHWFDPEPARQEMHRILKKDGWLALLRNIGTNPEQNEAIGHLMTAEYGADFTVVTERPKGKPNHFYFGNDNFHKSTFPFQFNQTYAEFIGALTTASYMPDEEHPLFDKLKAKAKEVFNQYSTDGYLPVEGKTELLIGQPTI